MANAMGTTDTTYLLFVKLRRPQIVKKKSRKTEFELFTKSSVIGISGHYPYYILIIKFFAYFINIKNIFVAYTIYCIYMI